MALRDKLRERLQPLLEPGEEIRQVFLAQTGPSPYFAFLTYLIFFWTKYYVVAVTDREVAVLRAGMWTPAKPKTWYKRLPRATRLGAPMSGLWSSTVIDGEKFWVHKRFHGDVAAADADLGEAATTTVAPAAAPAGGWVPTHAVPPDNLPAWAAPDPSAPPAATLAAGLPLQVVEWNGAWARVRAENGWSGWVDGRRLVAG